jgi:hypothetical protein
MGGSNWHTTGSTVHAVSASESRSSRGLQLPKLCSGVLRDFIAKRGSAVSRVLLFGAFTLFMYAAGYQPASTHNAVIGNATFYLDRTISAANAGYPFMAYVSEQGTDRPATPQRFDRLSSGYLDAGLPMLVSGTSLVGRAIFGPGFLVDDHTVYAAMLGLLLATAGLFVLPSVPLPIAAGALVALAWTGTVGPPGMTAFSGSLWGEAYSAILLCVLVAVAPFARFRLTDVLCVCGLGVILGFTQFLRQETTVSVAVVSASVLIATWLIAAIAGPLLHDRGLWLRIVAPWAMRPTAVFGAVEAINLAAPLLVRAAYALAWRVPFGDTREAVHGAGHPVYLGLGYVDNPYNISWRDQVGRIHELLIRPDIPIENHAYQDVLRNEWLRVVLESPWILFENMWAKFETVINTLIADQLGWVLIAFLLTIIAGFLGVALLRSPGLFVSIIGYAAVMVGTAVPPLLIFPDYVGGFRGALAGSICLGSGSLLVAARPHGKAMLSLPASLRHRAITRSALAMIAAGLFLSLLVIGWMQVRSNLRPAELRSFLEREPRGELADLGYRFGQRFNQLAMADQQRVIEELKTSGDQLTFANPSATTPPTTYFEPVLALSAGHELHVVVWLGPGVPALGYKDQGNATRFIRYCTGCEMLPDTFSNDVFNLRDDRTSKDITGIHDAAWWGNYRWISFPIETVSSPPDNIEVGLQVVDSFDGALFHLHTLRIARMTPVVTPG